MQPIHESYRKAYLCMSVEDRALAGISLYDD
jgi:hypothetical protein